MVRALALVVMLFVIGEATGSIEFALGDACRSEGASSDSGCPACVLCSCCAAHLATNPPAARPHESRDLTAFVGADSSRIPASHRTSPPRHPPKLTRV